MTDIEHHLAVPHTAALRALKAHAPIWQVGDGDGLWIKGLRDLGIESYGVDANPRSIFIMDGDHNHPLSVKCKTLLIVWPPDDDGVQEWIRAWHGPRIAIVGHEERIDLGNTLDGWRMVWRIAKAAKGHKGFSSMRVWERNAEADQDPDAP
jgi:hypothetical protein